MKKTADAASGIFRDESLRIREFLRKNSRGMNIREIAEALRINRNSVAKYMDVLTTREEVEVKSFGKSKVYFLSQRVPVSALGRFSSTLMVILNRDQRIVQINDPFLRLLNLPRESVIGSAVVDVDCPLLRNEDVISWSAGALQGKEVTSEISIPENGSFQHFRVVLTPTQFADHTPGVILIFENITEKKQIRSALAESEQNFRTLIEGSGDGCLIIDEEGTVITWNHALEEISGISSGNAVGMSVIDCITDLIIPEYRSEYHTERIRQKVLLLFMGKSSPQKQFPDEIPILRRDGQRRYIQQVSFPVMLGRKMHYGVIIRDVTGRKHMEEALVREKAFQNAVMDNVMGIFFVADENEQFIRWNRNLEQVTGYNAYELLHLRATDILAENERDCIRQKYGTILNEEMPEMIETQIVTRDGRKIPFLLNGVTTVIGDRKFRVGLGVDISKRKRAEALLRESEEKYRRIFETANEGIWGMDRNFRTTFVNQKITDLLGYSGTEMIGKRITEFMHPDELDDNSVREQNRRNGKKESYERHLIGKDGRSCWVWVSETPRTGADGAFEGSFAMLTDITKRREAEQALRALFRSMVGTTGPESLKKITENISSLLGADCVMVGELCPDRISVKVLAMLLDGKDVEDFSYSLRGTPCEDVAAKGFCIYPDHARDLFPHAKDLADLSIHGYAGTPLRDSGGETLGILCILSRAPFKVDQVTREIIDLFAVKASAEIERKRAESLLKTSEEKYRRIVETANEGIWGMDRNFRTTFVNQKITDLLGYPSNEMIGKHITEFMHPDELADNVVRTQNRMEGKRETYERRLLKKDGHSCWMLVSASPLADPDGHFEGSFAMMIDITRRREAEQVLRESEEQFRNLVEQVPGLAVQGYYMDGTTFFWNKASEMLYGYTAGEAIGRNLLDLIIPPEMKDDVKGAIAVMAASGQPIPSSDLSLMRKDGSRADVYSGHALIHLPGKPLQLFCMDIDLTERRRAELVIRESGDRFDQVAKNADEWIWEVDAEGLYRYSSAAVERILGYTPEEIVGKMHYYDLFDPSVRDELRNLAQAAFRSHEPFRKFVNANMHKNGNIVFLETRGTPVFDKQGTFTGYRGCDTDITERRNLEKARQEVLQQIEKNIGQFAVLGDHIRNPLTVILAEACNLPAESEKKITVQVREIDRIIRQIDRGWIESESVRSFLRKNYEIT
ncbi:MAG: PAS domain S-box protein [Methanoregula sp.]